MPDQKFKYQVIWSERLLFQRNIKSALIACMVILSTIVTGQPKTYLSFESGPAYDILRVNDPGNFFEQSLALGSITGISLKQDVLGNLAIGSGLYYHNNRTGINLIDRRIHQPEYKSFNAVYIPVQLSFGIHFLNLPLSLNSWIGYQYGIILNNEEEITFSSTINADNQRSLRYTYSDYTPLTDRLNLIEAGASINYHFNKNWQLALAFSYISGLERIETSTIDYQTPDGNTYRASYENDGSRMQTLLSFKMPISNLWQQKDIRLHRRIEHSSTRGSGIRKQRTFYFGAEVAPLWRTFTTTDPAIGPRQTFNLNVLNSANLYTGVFAGIMFENNVGIDIGGYYQRSSTFFTISYNANQEHFIKSRSPFILDFPMHIKYFYQVYETNFSLVPSVGISVPIQLFGQNETSNGRFQYTNELGTTNETYSYFNSRESFWGLTADIGLGIEYDIPINFPLNAFINTSYKFGYIELGKTSVNTSLGEQGTYSSIIYNGSGWKASLGVRIPILSGQDGRDCGAVERERKKSSRQKEDG